MTDMFERVAKAIYEARNGRGALPWNQQVKSHKAPYMADARAAIEAFLAAARDRLDDDEALSDAIHAELKRQQAFSIEKHGLIALATEPFSSLVLAAISPMTGFLATLTPEQRERALVPFDGDETLGEERT